MSKYIEFGHQQTNSYNEPLIKRVDLEKKFRKLDTWDEMLVEGGQQDQYRDYSAVEAGDGTAGTVIQRKLHALCETYKSEIQNMPIIKTFAGK